MEIEAKFLVPDEATLAALETVDKLAGYEAAPGERRHDADTFLDTPDGAFLASGYYLRRREAEDGVRLTLKQLPGAQSGVLHREELEMLVAADAPVAEWPAGELRRRVEKTAAGRALSPILALRQDRLARIVRRDGAEVAELSLDRVLVQAGGRDHAWFEAEVEARGEGGVDDVEALAAALRDDWGLTPETRAKFARAMELVQAGDNERAPRKAAGAAGGRRLIGARDRALHERFAADRGALGRRARALLALDEGDSQARAATRAGLSERRVRYWLARYRSDGLAVYGAAGREAPATDGGTGGAAKAKPKPAAAAAEPQAHEGEAPGGRAGGRSLRPSRRPRRSAPTSIATTP